MNILKKIIRSLKPYRKIETIDEVVLRLKPVFENNSIDIEAIRNECSNSGLYGIEMRRLYFKTIKELNIGNNEELYNLENKINNIKSLDVFNRKESNMYELLIAAKTNNNELFNRVFSEQARNINKQDSNGNTALHYAYHNRNMKMVAKLMIAKASNSIRNNEGSKAIQMLNKHYEVYGVAI